jgi:hypothetical protein
VGVDVRLETENGEVVDEVGDPRNVFVHMLPGSASDYTLLRYIDPYGHTVFNRMQMPDFLADLQSLRSSSESSEQTEIIDRIQQLAERSRDDPHYAGYLLRFSGD